MLKIIGSTGKEDAEKLVGCLLYLLTACVELGGFFLANSLREISDITVIKSIKLEILV